MWSFANCRKHNCAEVRRPTEVRVESNVRHIPMMGIQRSRQPSRQLSVFFFIGKSYHISNHGADRPLVLLRQKLVFALREAGDAAAHAACAGKRQQHTLNFRRQELPSQSPWNQGTRFHSIVFRCDKGGYTCSPSTSVFHNHLFARCDY